MSKSTTLSNRTKHARAALLFSKVLSSDTLDRINKVLVPGSEGKQYEVIIRRNGHITCECLHSTMGGNALHCEGAAKTVCYHAMAALIVAAERGGKRVSFCASEESANKLAHTGGLVFRIDSYVRQESHYHPVWMVVKEHKSKSPAQQERADVRSNEAGSVARAYTEQEHMLREQMASDAMTAALERRAEMVNEYIMDGSDDRPSAVNASDYDPANYLMSARAELEMPGAVLIADERSGRYVVRIAATAVSFDSGERANTHHAAFKLCSILTIAQCKLSDAKQRASMFTALHKQLIDPKLNDAQRAAYRIAIS